jgi:isoleucyl-tRNA synthetase
MRIGLPTDKPVSLVIWTTTPWTLPANVAIAVHPEVEYEFVGTATERFLVAHKLYDAFQEVVEPRFVDNMHFRKGRDLVGLRARHPFLDRDSVVIAADFVTTETGTGQVHIAPGHGADDYIAGMQNKLPVLSPVDDQGRLTEEAGVPAWTGKYVFDANKEIVAFLRDRGSLLAEQSYTHSYPHCWRSKTPIVFRAVEQFFLKIDVFRAEALKAIDGVTWLPEWARNRIYGTVESRPDWCISRQRTWGVPLPVFYDADGKPIVDAALARKVADLVETKGTNLWFSENDAWWCEQLGLPAGTTRRNDTLDVWIDSGVSHTAVVRKRPELGGPDSIADVYIEATDQHRGWFQSSLMTSIAMYGRAPYKTVITHGFVVDKDTRKKVSKSEQGTYAKPMNAEHFVGKYGADIVRLWAASVDYQNEVPFSEESFKGLAESYRSFRNILRILLANLDGFEPAQASLDGATTIDRWVLARLQEVIATAREAYEAYDFRKVFQTLNQFVTVEISALYVDITKDRLYCDAADSPRRRATQTVMHRVFEDLARLLAPILAFTADEAWEFAGEKTSVHLELFPAPDAALRDPALEAQMEQLLKLRGIIAQAVEGARAEKLIGNALEGAVALQIADETLFQQLQSREAELEELFILSDLTLIASDETSARVVRTARQKCARCWRHRDTVGEIAAQPELCDRCAAVVAAK